MPEWAEGLHWNCRGCERLWPSEWARDICELEHAEEDRAARRR